MYGYRFDHIRINGTLSQELHIFNMLSFFGEHVDEKTAYDLTLLFGIGNAVQLRIEKLFGIYTLGVQTKVFVAVQYLLKLVFAQQAVVNKYAIQVTANGFMHQRSSYR